ncbi:MAG: aspartyl/asparaginyl beta-hydroxylase domain-containing protein [Pyrinomonadaceae bacterium]
MINCLKLPLSFDAAGLKSDLARLAPDEWTPHFNKSYYEGEWSGVALRSIGGVAGQIYPDPTRNDFADTPVLARLPRIAETLEAFCCPLQSVRFLKLAAGASIREHKDYNLGYEDGELRIHIPVQTNALVEFYLAGERVVMCEGESWYVNFNLPHRVHNRSDADRIHLVLDCVVNDWLRAQFPPEREKH